MVELGYHTAGDTLKREEFEGRQKAELEKHLLKENVPKPLASMGKDLSDCPFLQSLANREELVRNGKLTVGPRLHVATVSICGPLPCLCCLGSTVGGTARAGQNVVWRPRAEGLCSWC